MNDERLTRAEAFVREILAIMGQHRDARDPDLVKAIALSVLAAFPQPQR